MLLFFAFIFFWYSQVTERSFYAGVSFIEDTIINLNNFFIVESRTSDFEHLVGKGLAYPVLSRANLAFTWGTFILIGIGILSMLKRYKEMVFIPGTKQKKPDFLKTQFEAEYLVLSLACSGLLILTLALPYLSTGYDIERLYPLMTVILSVCFVMGGITLSHFFFFYKKRKPVLKEKNNVLQVRAYLIILLILIPYSMFGTGALYQIFGAHAVPTLNSGLEIIDQRYIYDSESCAAKWLKVHGKLPIHSRNIYVPDRFGRALLISQGKMRGQINRGSFSKHGPIRGYIYLCYNNVVKGKLEVDGVTCNMTEYSDRFIGKSNVYDSGYSEIYR